VVSCTSDPDPAPAGLTGDLVVEDPRGDVEDGPFGPAPSGGVADITGFAIDERGDDVVFAVQLARLPGPDDALSQGMDVSGQDPDRPREVMISTTRNRLKPVRASLSVRDDAAETIRYPCDGGVRAAWSDARGTVSIAVPRSCLPDAGLELFDPSAGFGARTDTLNGVDGVDLPDRLVVPVP